MPVKPIPEGYHAITPYLFIDGAAGAIDFYKKVFSATELFRMPDPSGKRIAHAWQQQRRGGTQHLTKLARRARTCH